MELNARPSREAGVSGVFNGVIWCEVLAARGFIKNEKI